MRLCVCVCVFIGGPKIISLNEKRRGFPTGLRVMSSETNTTCLLQVDSALETACYRGNTMTIVRLEVWGCGGDKAAESQQKMKEWEKQLILKRRKVYITHTHTHTHTHHTHTHTQKHNVMHVHTYAHSHVHTHTPYSHTHTKTQCHACAHIRTLTCTHTHTHTRHRSRPLL